MLAAEYQEMLLGLFPPGAIWPRGPDTTLGRLAGGLAEELARADARLLDLIDESDPRTTLEMLTDWEAALGLPDQCSLLVESLDERRAAAVAKLVARGGQSIAYYKTLALAVGIEIEVEEFFPSTCVGLCTQALYDVGWAHTWRVVAPGTTVRHLTCLGACTDPLAWWGNELLECLIRARKPAHTLVLFAYYQRLTTEDGEVLTTEDGEPLVAWEEA